MKSIKRSLPALLAATLMAAPAPAQNLPELLPDECERALALAAAPQHLRDGAAIYLLRQQGYELARKGSNGFTCLVNRDDPRSVKPTCFDAEGSRTIVPKILEVGKLLRQGIALHEIHRRLEAGFADGTFESPARPGVAYMLSPYNRPYRASTGQLGWFPPHTMFYAPDLTNEEIGFSPETYQSDVHLPFVAYQGPQGYMIVRAQAESRPHEVPLPACPTWLTGPASRLPDESRQFDFWIGEWDVNLRIRQEDGTWPDKIRSAAKIYPILQGKAVLEFWDSEPIKGYSLRYFDPAKGKWVLWLDWPSKNRSGSSGLEGVFHHGRGEFFAEYPQEDGSTTLSRYSFSDITPTSLRWDDAFSKDGGKTWTHGWIMEFTRTGQRPELPRDRDTAHTYHTGERCTLEPFRHFEALAGRRSGTIKVRDAGGEWQETKANLTGYKVLDGCAVISFLTYEHAGETFEAFRFHTWNTHASVFEETHLDNAPASPLSVYYGSEADGAVELLLSDENDAQARTRRNRWHIESDTIRFETEVTDDGGETWRSVAAATFEH